MKIDKNDIYEKILEEHSSVIYLADIETYELVYMNRGTMRMLGLPLDERSYAGKPCYEVLQGRTAPCEFCNNDQINYQQFICWEYYNPLIKRYFSIRDKKILLCGRELRLEIADDISQIVLEKQRLQNDLSAEKSLVLCIQNLTAAESDDHSIHQLLEKICDLYEGDRGYIFEFDLENQTCTNTYEWCKIGVRSEMNNLQNLPLAVAQPWIDKFNTEGCFRIASLDREVEPGSLEFEVLAPQGINSIVSVPLLKEEQIVGFIGVDNPKKQPEDLSLMKTMAQFVANDMEKRKILKELEQNSNVDLLSKVYNRNRYISDIKKLYGEKTMPLGVIFLDLDNLKRINDSHGHSFGDRVIERTASILNEAFPDEVYRIGGDEFIVLSKGLPPDTFESKVKGLREAFQTEEIRISLGTKWLLGGRELREAILFADGMMYREKANNKKHDSSPKEHI